MLKLWPQKPKDHLEIIHVFRLKNYSKHSRPLKKTNVHSFSVQPFFDDLISTPKSLVHKLGLKSNLKCWQALSLLYVISFHQTIDLIWIRFWWSTLSPAPSKFWNSKMSFKVICLWYFPQKILETQAELLNTPKCPPLIIFRNHWAISGFGHRQAWRQPSAAGSGGVRGLCTRLARVTSLIGSKRPPRHVDRDLVQSCYSPSSLETPPHPHILVLL